MTLVLLMGANDMGDVHNQLAAEDVYLDERQLAARLRVSVKWCQKHRAKGTGPKWFKFEGSVRYGLRDLEQYEANCRQC